MASLVCGSFNHKFTLLSSLKCHFLSLKKTTALPALPSPSPAAELIPPLGSFSLVSIPLTHSSPCITAVHSPPKNSQETGSVQRTGTRLTHFCQDGSQLGARLKMIELNWKKVAKIIVALADGSWSHPSCPPLPHPKPWCHPSFPQCPGSPPPLTPEGLCYCGSSDLQLHLAESNQKCEYSPSIWHTSSEL